jgi:hypothetical protein
MRITTSCLAAATFLLTAAAHGEIFSAPPKSAVLLQGVDLTGTPIAPRIKKDFSDCDRIPHSVQGKPQASCMGRKRVNGKWVADPMLPGADPNRNTALLKLSDGTILFDAKMAVDADGSDYAKEHNSFPDSPDTSLRYSNNSSLDADKVPYVVLPIGFPQATGLKLGDVAAVVYEDRIAFAVVGDQSKSFRVGEGSMALHDALGQNGCARRQAGICTQPKGHSIPSNVVFLIFPNTRKKLCQDEPLTSNPTRLCAGVTPDNINERITSVGQEAFGKLKR